MNEVTQNVDRAEVKKFEDLASRWWDKQSEFKPLHEINPLRLDFIMQSAEGLANKSVIDVGCGGGILSESMARKGAIVTGIDMGTAPLEVAKLHMLESGLNIDYQQSTAEEKSKSATEQYDVVTCLEMLEHVPEPASVIQACCDMVKPGGHVFFSTINRNPKAFLLAVVAAEYIMNMLPKGTHDYAKFIKPSELCQWIRQTSLDVKSMTGMHYNPISKTYKLGDGVDVNYLVHCQKPLVS
jgi:2-polyprenyl-6-hydroxyphenyl methylase / 3-demethylubiquinone-9 3-methyltransferase